MRKSIISLILLCCSVAPAPAAITDDLIEGAPDRYVVVPGDTLWTIASRFLKSPWKWNDLWKTNRDQISNPNRIYPGDVLVLDKSAEEMRLKLLRAEVVRVSPQIRSEQLAPEPVQVIPTADIEPFLTKPLVIAQNQLASAPRIVRTQESRVAVGAGDIAYANGLTKEKGVYWQIFRPGEALMDPVSNETLGYVANYLGEAKVNKLGDVSTIEIVSSPQEIYAGDYLQPSPREVILDGFTPHAPVKKVDARIIALYNQLYEAGPRAVITLNRGARDGLEAGHVLAIYRNLNAPTFTLRESPLYGPVGIMYDEKNPKTNYESQPMAGRGSPLWGRVGPAGADFKDDKTSLPSVTLPDERYGLLMVFRVFDRAAYALVMNASRPVNVLDIVTNP
ncbi:MAG: LysM peptidoglycan-binding domain-containing protein [Proteobacteria bacterium]|nr:LysM peptidoglycan-binding domain-containing protein [Pseudomonadota bacterium]